MPERDELCSPATETLQRTWLPACRSSFTESRGLRSRETARASSSRRPPRHAILSEMDRAASLRDAKPAFGSSEAVRKGRRHSQSKWRIATRTPFSEDDAVASKRSPPEVGETSDVESLCMIPNSMRVSARARRHAVPSEAAFCCCSMRRAATRISGFEAQCSRA